MATTDRPATGNATDPAALAAAIQEAPLCHLIVRTEGDALASAAILANACETSGTAYHARPIRTRDELRARLDTVDEAAQPIVLGATVPDEPSINETTPSSLVAADVATELGVSPDPVLTLAGVVAAGEYPETLGESIYESASLERRPGIASPTDDPIDGLTHTMLAHGEYSARPEVAHAAVADLDVDDRLSTDGRRMIASLLAISIASDGDLSDRGADAVERALRPHDIDGPVATLEGYADVLSALALERPGLGLALGLGTGTADSAIEIWREHATRAHEAVRSASVARHDGIVVARVDAAVETTARLVRDFRSPEPVVLAIDETAGEAAITGIDTSVGHLFETAVDEVGGDALGSGPTGFARLDDPESLITVLRRDV